MIQPSPLGQRGPNAFEQFAASMPPPPPPIDPAQLQTTARQLGEFRTMLEPLVRKPDVSVKDLTELGVKLIQAKIARPQDVAAKLSGFPHKGAPQEKLGFVHALYAHTVDRERQIAMMLAPPPFPYGLPSIGGGF